MPTSTDNVLYWAADSIGHAYFPIAIDAGDYSAIDGGLCRIDSYAHQSSFDATLDIGRFYVEFRDAGGALLGSRVNSNATEFHGGVNGSPRWIDAAVPVGTRTIRWGMTGTKAAAGTANDAYQKWISVFLKKPI